MTKSYSATITLTGVDGSQWNLSGPGHGSQGVELAPNPAGLYDPPTTTIWNSTAFQDGATYGGNRTEKRDVVFAVNIFHMPGLSWEQLDSQWRKAWAYDTDSTLTIATESGSRSLSLRLSEHPDFAPAHDPHQKRWGSVTMTCTAGVPWWVEADTTSVWVS